MSIENAKKQLTIFLRDPSPSVLAMRGGWGTGKTYCWNKFLEIEKGNINFDNYSYITLFGAKSIEQIKFNICSSSLEKTHIGENLSLSEILGVSGFDYRDWRSLHNLRKLKKIGTRGLSTYAKYSGDKNNTLITDLTFNYLESTLICIDDFDRKGKELNAKEVLGMISFLKEHRDCKILLIYNEGNLDETEKEDYKELREKVIDYEIQFCPTSDEVLEIVFNGNSDNDKALKLLLEKHIRKLGIKNIRILEKIKGYSAKLKIALGENYGPELINQAFSTAVLLNWSFYSGKNDAPDFNFLKNYNRHYEIKLKGESEENNEEAKWESLLKDYCFYNCDDFDSEIADSIEINFIDNEKLNKLAEPLDYQFKLGKSRDSFFESYENVFKSFDCDEIKLAKEFLANFKSNIKFLNVLDLDCTVQLLKELDKDISTEDLIRFYLSEHSNRPGVSDLDSYSLRGEIKDKELIRIFKDKFKKTTLTEPVGEVLIRLSKNNGWNTSDIEILNSASESDLYDFLKNPGEGYIGKIIKRSLELVDYINQIEGSKSFSENIISVFKRIEAENEFNKRVLQRFGFSSNSHKK
jgi:hypothetical protein